MPPDGVTDGTDAPSLTPRSNVNCVSSSEVISGVGPEPGTVEGSGSVAGVAGHVR